eukprot:5960936-Prymnesium_polylepis.1
MRERESRPGGSHDAEHTTGHNVTERSVPNGSTHEAGYLGPRAAGATAWGRRKARFRLHFHARSHEQHPPRGRIGEWLVLGRLACLARRLPRHLARRAAGRLGPR